MKTNWYTVLDAVKDARGKTKQEILEKNKDVPYLKEVLAFVFDPLMSTGISKKKWDKDVILEKGSTSDLNSKINLDMNVLEIINVIENNNTGKMDIVSYLKTVVDNKFFDTEKDFLKRIIIKDMNIGISAKTINKVWPNLIFEFEIMKATKFDKQDLSEKDILITLKVDGNNAVCFNLEDKTYFLSRSGRLIEGLDHLVDYYRTNIPKGFVYFGELLLKNEDKLEHGELFQKTNGIVNSKNKDKSNIQHVLFDSISYEDYLNKENRETFRFRRARLAMAVGEMNYYEPYMYDNYETVEYVPDLNIKTASKYNAVDNNDLIIKSLDMVTKDGLEGVMVNDLDAPYEFKRGKSLLKVKQFNTMDLLVVGIEEHTRGGKVGAIKLQYKDNTVGIGSITETQRNEWWIDPDLIIGKIVEVGYFRETEDENGKPSLRFPTLIRVREDKTYEDISYD